MTPRILFVDDERQVLDGLRRLLEPYRRQWDLRFASVPEVAWEELHNAPVDVAVLDVCMPGTSGLELLQRMQDHPATRGVAVIMLTGLEDRTLKRQALELGAADLLNKPVQREDLVARLQSVLRFKAAQDALRRANAELEEKVQKRTRQLAQSRLDIIWRLGSLAEYRHAETGQHVVRVGYYSRLIAEAMGLDVEFQEMLFLAAPLHDIGKIAIPDRILLKRGPLSAAETAIMRRHCEIGERILRGRAPFGPWRPRAAGPLAPIVAECNPLLDKAATIALAHHERWDGTGYPQGLAGNQIPLEARIVAIADVFDALTSERPYRAALGREDALRIIGEQKGGQFDPEVHAAFFRALEDLQQVRQQWLDQFGGRWSEEPSDEPDFVCG